MHQRAQVGHDAEQGEECAGSLHHSRVPGSGARFHHNEGLAVSSEAAGVEEELVPTSRGKANICEVRSEAAWPNGSSSPGCATGLASYEAATTVVLKEQGEPYEDGQHVLQMDAGCVPGIHWWLAALDLQKGVPLGQRSSRETVTTDASSLGWGAMWQGCPVQGLWESTWQGVHVNLLELEAVRRALVYFLLSLQAGNVLVRTDSSTVVSYINRQGGIRSVSLHQKAYKLLRWAHAHNLALRAVYLPGEDNVAADLLSRGGPRPGE